MKTFNIRRYETRSGYNFYVQDPNARKKTASIVGTIEANTIDDAIKALKSYFNKFQMGLKEVLKDGIS